MHQPIVKKTGQIIGHLTPERIVHHPGQLACRTYHSVFNPLHRNTKRTRRELRRIGGVGGIDSSPSEFLLH